MDESIALVEVSKHSRRVRRDYARIEDSIPAQVAALRRPAPLRDADRWVAELVASTPRLRQRVDVALSRLTAPARLAAAAAVVDRLKTAVDAARGSPALRATLRLALVVGNAVNAGTSREAAGVGVGDLHKLAQVKGSAGARPSLLRFLAELARETPGLAPCGRLGLEVVAPLARATKDEPGALGDALAGLRADVRRAEDEAKQQPDDAAPLRDFARWLETQVRGLVAAEATAARDADALLALFGADAKGDALRGNQTVSWVIPTKLQNSLARSHRSRFG